MRMRKRHNLEPRMERCADYITAEPQNLKGRWREQFTGFGSLFLELGCGKGRFTVETAKRRPDAMLVAVEKVPDAMIIAVERAKNAGLNNVTFIDGDAARLCEMFDKGEVDRIFINFCDPWPKSRDAKFRLTAPSFLRIYCELLPLGGQIHFKTDNRPLFDWSVEQFISEGWELSEVTNDLHGNGIADIPLTDYEAKFLESGLKINRLVATKVTSARDTSAPALQRIRNAALTDARGYEESVKDAAEE